MYICSFYEKSGPDIVWMAHSALWLHIAEKEVEESIMQIEKSRSCLTSFIYGRCCEVFENIKEKQLGLAEGTLRLLGTLDHCEISLYTMETAKSSY